MQDSTLLREKCLEQRVTLTILRRSYFGLGRLFAGTRMNQIFVKDLFARSKRNLSAASCTRRRITPTLSSHFFSLQKNELLLTCL